MRSTKAGARTPATPSRPRSPSRGPSTLNEGRGRQPRRHFPAGRCRNRLSRSLNEGRGANPGDTLLSRRAKRLGWGAQRRPGRQPRRHMLRRYNTRTGWDAQRRPGRQPRRHFPAGRCRNRLSRSLNEGRGANPGDTHARPGCSGRTATLNEGRGTNPGDTRPRAVAGLPDTDRSTKAGTPTRRHERHGRDRSVAAERSTKAGAPTPATPVPGAAPAG